MQRREPHEACLNAGTTCWHRLTSDGLACSTACSAAAPTGRDDRRLAVSNPPARRLSGSRTLIPTWGRRRIPPRRGSQTLIVGTAVVSLWSTQPDALAANAHLVAESAPGRLALGVGVSHQPLVEAAGVTFDQPQRRLERFMDELNSVLDRSLLAATLVGANGPKALAASCRQASGAVPYLVTVEHTRRARSIMSAESLLAPVVKVVAETDPLIARSIARRRLAFYWTLPNYVSSMRRVGFEDSDFVDGGSDRLVDAVCAWGDPDQIAERLHEHQAAGADHVSIHLLRTDADDPTDRWCSVIEAFHSAATALS